ncbi:hypothetical protein BDZ97DRAFT_1766174 [Flammula alnicola]|nr:hypothetical protein BDZ97DRAFT_1766174 [Flammula alnicola]
MPPLQSPRKANAAFTPSYSYSSSSSLGRGASRIACKNPAKVDIANPEWWKMYLPQSMEVVLLLLRRTTGILGRQASRRVGELEDALNGLPGTPSSRKILERGGKLAPIDGTAEVVPEVFRNFASQIKASLTLDIATERVRKILPTEIRRERDEDLGARALFPDVDIVDIEGGHLDFLEDKALLRSIQGDYYVG